MLKHITTYAAPAETEKEFSSILPTAECRAASNAAVGPFRQGRCRPPYNESSDACSITFLKPETGFHMLPVPCFFASCLYTRGALGAGLYEYSRASKTKQLGLIELS